jgi:predicted RNase H-like nuclease (RuvC/YqgF family)
MTKLCHEIPLYLRFLKGEIVPLFGVVAQKIEKVIPEVVKEGPGGEKSVSYAEIIPVLIEAMKEQQRAIERQQKEMEELKAEMDRLKGGIYRNVSHLQP